jgi:hypothetical protein
MVARTSPKVSASNEASATLHSAAALEVEYEMEGLSADLTAALLHTLQVQGIGASLGAELESKMIEVYSSLVRDSSADTCLETDGIEN